MQAQETALASESKKRTSDYVETKPKQGKKTHKIRRGSEMNRERHTPALVSCQQKYYNRG
jgi:hypothetical protein